MVVVVDVAVVAVAVVVVVVVVASDSFACECVCECDSGCSKVFAVRLLSFIFYFSSASSFNSCCSLIIFPYVRTLSFVFVLLPFPLLVLPASAAYGS